MHASKNELRLLFWETTVGCNLKCVHCRASAQAGGAPDELTTEEALDFIEDLAGFSQPILVLSGGEPLYRPDIFRIAEFATWKGSSAPGFVNAGMSSLEKPTMPTFTPPPRLKMCDGDHSGGVLPPASTMFADTNG